MSELLAFLEELLYTFVAIAFILIIAFIVLAILVTIQYFNPRAHLWQMAKQAGMHYSWLVYLPFVFHYYLCTISKRKFSLFNGTLKLKKSSYSYWFLLLWTFASWTLLWYIYRDTSYLGIFDFVNNTHSLELLIALSIPNFFCRYVWYRNLAETYLPDENAVALGLCSSIIPLYNLSVWSKCSKRAPLYGVGMYHQFSEYDQFHNVYEEI